LQNETNMSLVFTSIAVSLDGFIASKSGDQSWLNGAMAKGEDYGFEATLKRAGVFLIGANTYREMLKSGMAGGRSGPPVYVVTRAKDLKPGKGVHFYEGDLKQLVEEAKSGTEKDIYVWGGGDLITQFIDRDLLDELQVAVLPVLLGDGVPLFGKIDKLKKLELAASETFEKSGIVILKYIFPSKIK
jgi:dihydrofolate reductase